MTDAPPDRPQPEQTAAAGPWGGPTYAYRGAEIRCLNRLLKKVADPQALALDQPLQTQSVAAAGSFSAAC